MKTKKQINLIEYRKKEGTSMEKWKTQEEKKNEKIASKKKLHIDDECAALAPIQCIYNCT